MANISENITHYLVRIWIENVHWRLWKTGGLAFWGFSMIRVWIIHEGCWSGIPEHQHKINDLFPWFNMLWESRSFFMELLIHFRFTRIRKKVYGFHKIASMPSMISWMKLIKMNAEWISRNSCYWSVSATSSSSSIDSLNQLDTWALKIFAAVGKNLGLNRK